jgi:hypothetical protein
MNVFLAAAFIGSTLASCGSNTDSSTTAEHLKTVGGGPVEHHGSSHNDRDHEPDARHSPEEGSERVHSHWSVFGTQPTHDRERDEAPHKTRRG